MSDLPEAVDWRLAARVAAMVAGSGPAVPAPERERMRRDFAELTDLSDGLVRRYTGLAAPDPPGAPIVLDRAGWIKVNLDGFQALMRPLERKVAAHRGGASRRVTRSALGVQLGVLLGYLSQKVLGQYDLLLAAEGAGRVYFVGPNVAGAERRAGVAPREFRLWITLHEITHRTQFTVAPWLRSYLKELVERYIASVDLDGRRLRESFGKVREAMRAGPDALRRLDVLSLFLTPEQRGTVAEVQAVMTVVEGHGNFVMDHVGAEQIPGQQRMKESFARRRAQTGAAERLLQRVLGIDMKYQQYARGEQFVAAVHRLAGMDAVNRVWERRENLPAPDELGDPSRWLARMDIPERPPGPEAPPRPETGPEAPTGPEAGPQPPPAASGGAGA